MINKSVIEIREAGIEKKKEIHRQRQREAERERGGKKKGGRERSRHPRSIFSLAAGKKEREVTAELSGRDRSAIMIAILKIARRHDDGSDVGIMGARFAALRARALCHRPRGIDVSRNKPVIIYKEATARGARCNHL